MNKKALIVGGNSGMGWEMAQLLKKDFRVTVTGRTKKQEYGDIDFKQLCITRDADECELALGHLAQQEWDVVVYAPGFYQEGLIDEFLGDDIQLMNNVCLTIPEMLIGSILEIHGTLGQLVVVTSTSAVKPRLREPLYSAAKAGLHMLTHCLQEDERIESVVLAVPCGMNTEFYASADRDTGAFADPKAIAERVVSFMRERVQFIELRFERIDEAPYFKHWQERRIHTNPK